MTGLLNFRKRMILFSRKNENWLKIVLRFIGFLIVFMYVNRSIGYIAAMSGAANQSTTYSTTPMSTENSSTEL